MKMITKEIETKSRGNLIKRLERRLKSLRQAVDSNNVELWESSENSLLSILINPSYNLNSLVRKKFFNAYHNIIPPKNFLYQDGN